ncbi:MAG: heavy-metal-associated domain-containing protein [Nitriliruptoraceae bacterium]
MTTVTDTTRTVLRAEGFSCPSCIGKIEKQVGRLPGVRDAETIRADGSHARRGGCCSGVCPRIGVPGRLWW